MTKSVVVAIDQKYNDNNGPSACAIVWDGESIDYQPLQRYDEVAINASCDQIDAASKHFQLFERYVPNDANGHSTYVGCTVNLHRSRKAPNGVPVEVVNLQGTYFHETFRCHMPPKIQIKHEEQTHWISIGCIKYILQYAKPWWSRV